MDGTSSPLTAAATAAEEEVPKNAVLRETRKTAVVEEAVPKKAVHAIQAEISLNTAMKMSTSPCTAVVEEEGPKEAVHKMHAEISLNMAMKMSPSCRRPTSSRTTSTRIWMGGSRPSRRL